ncbi:methyltransferase domain-containing protein, partial [Colletotrichum incanum]
AWSCSEHTQAVRVLDIGIGTDSWALNFRGEHPEAEILGIDLSANRPGLYVFTYIIICQSVLMIETQRVSQFQV